MNCEVFADNIKYLREQSGLTQKRAAEKLGITIKRYQAWEEARAFPSIPMFIKLCNFYRKRNIYKLVTTRLKCLQD